MSTKTLTHLQKAGGCTQGGMLCYHHQHPLRSELRGKANGLKKMICEKVEAGARYITTDINIIFH